MNRIRSIFMILFLPLLGVETRVNQLRAEEILINSLGKGKEITAVMYTGKNHYLDIIGTYDMLGKKHKSKYSLLTIAKKNDILGALNGGESASKSYPIPKGGLWSHGKLVSEMTSSDTSLGWLVCSDENEVKIIEAKDFKERRLNSCVQSGPMLIQNGKVIVAKDKIKMRRSAICLSKENNILLVQSDAVSFFELAKNLIAKPFLCQSVLAMASGYQSGLVYKKEGETHRIGETENTISSALLIYQTDLKK